MRESVFYQEIEAQGERRGRQAEAATLILRLLTRRLNSLPVDLRTQVEHLPLPRLEALSEALLDFQRLAELEAWLVQF